MSTKGRRWTLLSYLLLFSITLRDSVHAENKDVLARKILHGVTPSLCLSCHLSKCEFRYGPYRKRHTIHIVDVSKIHKDLQRYHQNKHSLFRAWNYYRLTSLKCTSVLCRQLQNCFLRFLWIHASSVSRNNADTVFEFSASCRFMQAMTLFSRLAFSRSFPERLSIFYGTLRDNSLLSFSWDWIEVSMSFHSTKYSVKKSSYDFFNKYLEYLIVWLIIINLSFHILFFTN